MFEATNYIPLNLKNEAVDIKTLSTNYIDIISDCGGIEDFQPKTVLQNRFPLAVWLLNTPFARYLRQRSTDAENFTRSSEANVIRDMKIPGSVWTLAPENSSDDCCWTMPDFAKCASDVPLYGLCLKDCDNIYEDLFYRRLGITSRQSLDGISRTGESMKEVNRRIQRLWMAFYTAHTIVLGTSNTSDNITKPFHGLVEVLENEAVMSIYGANILGGFASLGCRLDVLGGTGYVFAVNPIIMNAIEAVVTPDANGKYPYGWSRQNGELYFHGIGFIPDPMVPVDLANSTGEVWLLAGDSVGAFLATNLMPEGDFVIEDDFTEQTKANGCGTLCTYLYNFGAVANNNAQRLAVITDIPFNSNCADSIGDLGGIIQPNTLIPDFSDTESN